MRIRAVLHDRVIEQWPSRALGRLRDKLRFLSLRPFDESSAEGRAQERHRRVALSAAAAALAKLLSVGTALISVPLTLHYLGAERFGMWMTISSLIAMLAFADFGIANGVLSAVAEAKGRDDRAAIQQTVSSGVFVLAGIAVGLAGLLCIAWPFIAWPEVFNVKGELARSEVACAVAVFSACFLMAIPLGVVQRVQMGLQQGFSASLWQCAGSICGLMGVLLAIACQAGLPWLVLALAGAPLLAALGNSIYFYGSQEPDLRPRLQWTSASAARQLAATGALFFVLQLSAAIAFTSDNIVISQLLGASSVTAYAIPEKLFGLVTLALTMMLAPLWPAYGEAIARGDSAWVRRTVCRSLLVAVAVAGVASIALIWAAPGLMRFWVGEAVQPAVGLLVVLALWKVVEAAGTAVAMFLNGARVIKFQVWVASATACVAIVLKLVLVPRIGISGAVLATTIAYVLCALIPYAIFVPRLAVLMPLRHTKT